MKEGKRRQKKGKVLSYGVNLLHTPDLARNDDMPQVESKQLRHTLSGCRSSYQFVKPLYIFLCYHSQSPVCQLIL